MGAMFVLSPEILRDMRILVVEDEPKMSDVLKRGLTRAGLAVDVVEDGGAALVRAGATEYDAIVLDAMLPDIDGVEICRRLREQRIWSPVLMLTARAGVADRVTGLDAGADDYLAKPFSFDELLARLRALVRRGPVERGPVLEVGDLRLDPAGHRAWRGDAPLNLSAKELAMLEIFMRNPGQVLSRFTLLEHAWEGEYENRSNVVDVYVRLLREKIDRPFGRQSLQTVRGLGYRLCEP
jgi:two-component system OmpR family response regulator